MSGTRLGVVVVGTGFGCRVHVPAARAAGLDVVALVGRDRERAARRAERSGVAEACGSLTEALRLPHSDIVVIASPPATHAELAEEAIAAGRHVLVEKPFTTSVGDARRLVDGASRAGVTALVGHEFRFAPERVTFRQAVRDGLVGTPRIATFVGHLPLVAPPDMKAPPWWFDPDLGGGWLGASVSHLVDAIRSWLGEFESVSAALPMVSGRDPATHAEDTASARFRLRSGCEGVLQQSAGVWGERVEIMRVAGPLGTLSLHGDAVTLANPAGTERLDPVGPPLPVEAAPSDDPRHAFTHLELGPAIVQAGILRDLALGGDAEYDLVPPATFADGLACMVVLDAVRRSASQGGAVTPTA
ncbi:MAG: Gfo/Idh/MocA family protein [Acidimicrobiales bacterium]